MEELDIFFAALQASEDPYIRRESLAHEAGELIPEDRKSLTHLVLKEVHDFPAIANAIHRDKSINLIGLVRDPVAVLKSWISAPGEWSPDWNIEEEWFYANEKNCQYRGNHFGVKAWLETTEALLQLERERPSQVTLLKYRDLKEEPSVVVAAILGSLGLDLSPEVKDLIQRGREASDSNPYSIFRGAVGDYAHSVIPDFISKKTREITSRKGLGDFLDFA